MTPPAAPPPVERRSGAARASLGRRLACERGQSMVLGMTMLTMLVLFVGLSVNIGQAVNRRMGVQILADAGAYTGATNMAIGANGVAYWNRQIQEAWALLTWATGGFIMAPSCVVNDQAVSAYRTFRRVMGMFLQVTNLGYVQVASNEARRSAVFSSYDLFPAEVGLMRYQETDPRPDVNIGARRNLRAMFPDQGVFTLGQVPSGARPNSRIPALSGARRSAAWLCYCPECPPPLRIQPRFGSFDVWYRKADPRTNYFSFIATAPRAEALLLDRFFGGMSIPEIKAAAAAKPVGGSIERGESRYVTKMMPLRNVMGGGFLSGLLPLQGPQQIVFDDGIGGVTRMRVTH